MCYIDLILSTQGESTYVMQFCGTKAQLPKIKVASRVARPRRLSRPPLPRRGPRFWQAVGVHVNRISNSKGGERSYVEHHHHRRSRRPPTGKAERAARRLGAIQNPEELAGGQEQIRFLVQRSPPSFPGRCQSAPRITPLDPLFCSRSGGIRRVASSRSPSVPNLDPVVP